MKQYTKSKSSLFLMEFIITLLLFAVCAAICMKLFAAADTLSKKTEELNNAVACAQGFAEVMRGTDGTIDSIVKHYPESVKGNEGFFEVFYDGDFIECSYDEAKYVSDITLVPNGAIQNMEVKIVRLSDYEEIYSITVTKYMDETKG